MEDNVAFLEADCLFESKGSKAAKQAWGIIRKYAIAWMCRPVIDMDNAIIAWENHVKKHLKMNGPACDIAKDEKCKHWFIMGYLSTDGK